MRSPDEIAADIADHLPLRAVHKATAEARIEDALRAYADEKLEEAAQAAEGTFIRPSLDIVEAVASIRALKSRPPKSEDARNDDIAVTLSCGCVFCDLNLTPKYDGSWFHEGPRRIRVPCNKPLEPTP